jgi:hypothetical protein
MLAEMHCHTKEHSKCSFVRAEVLVRQICASGLEAAILTDHHHLWSDEELLTLKNGASLPGYFVILSGQEVTTSDVGDVLVYGASRSIPKNTPVAAIRADFPEAALVLAHPYRDGKIPATEKLLDPLFDAIEIFSSNHSISENTRGLRDWHRLRFTATGGTDSHAASYAGYYPTLFDHPVYSIQELTAELKKGRCRPFFEETPKSKAHVQVNEVTFGVGGDQGVRNSVIVRQFQDAERWESGRRAFFIMGEIRKHGFDRGKYRVPRVVGEDKEDMTLIEESLKNNVLFDKVAEANPERAKAYVRLSAEWLARLHALRLQITPPGEFLEVEKRRLDAYVAHFAGIDHRFTPRIMECADTIRTAEAALFERYPEKLFQGHGDYQPKNIYIVEEGAGADAPAEVGEYVGAIDFESSYCLPQAFDVAVFLTQFRNQFTALPAVIEEVPEDIFLDGYLSSVGSVDQGFFEQLELFRARADLSIASFLVQIGLGESENLWRVLIEAERALTKFEANG